MAMKHKNNHIQPNSQASKTEIVMPLAKKWWERNPEANILDIQNAIENMTQTPAAKEQGVRKVKKGLFRR